MTSIDRLTVEQLKDFIVRYSHTGEEMGYLFDNYLEKRSSVFLELAKENPKVKEAILDELACYSYAFNKEEYEKKYKPEWREVFSYEEIKKREKVIPKIIAKAFEGDDVNMAVLMYWLNKNRAQTTKVIKTDSTRSKITQKYLGGWAQREIIDQDEFDRANNCASGLYTDDITPQNLLRCFAKRPEICRNILEHDPVVQEKMRQFVAKNPNFAEIYQTAEGLGGNTLANVSKIIFGVLNKTAAEAKLKEDKTKDIQTILNLKDLNIYQLTVCLDIDEKITGEILRKNKELSDKVYQLFVNPHTYKTQKNIRERLVAGFDVDKAFKTCEGNLRSLSGDEVFTILTAPVAKGDMEKVKDAQNLKRVLTTFYEQTTMLSKRAPNAILYYDNIGKEEIWREDRNPLLELVGKYSDKPELEEMLQDRIGKIFSLHSYHEEETDFKGLTTVGANAFQKHMVEELLADPTSDKAKFYVKFADKVLNQNETRIRYLDMLAHTHQILQEHYPQEYKQMIKHIDNVKNPTEDEQEDFNALLFRELSDGQNTPAAQFCVERLKGIYRGKGSAKIYLQMVNKIIPQIAETQPEICDKMSEILPEICKKDNRYDVGDKYRGYMEDEVVEHPDSRLSKFYLDNFAKVLDLDDQIATATYIVSATGNSPDFKEIADRLCHDIATNPEYVNRFNDYVKYRRGRREFNVVWTGDMEEIGITLYEMHPTPEHAEAIAKMAEKIEPKADEFGHYYAASQLSGLKCFDKLMDTVLQKEKEVDMSMYISGLSYTDLINRIEQNADKMSVSTLRVRFNGSDDMTTEEKEHLFEVLMKNKPKSLHKIRGHINFTYEQCMALMEKYPDLYIESKGVYTDETKRKAHNKLQSRNEKIIQILDYEKGITAAAWEKLLIEVLPLLPKKKLPTMEELSKPVETEYWDSYGQEHEVRCVSTFHLLQQRYGSDYKEVVSKLAEFCKDDKLKQEVALWKAMEDGTIVQYLEQLPDNKRPTIEQLSGPMPSNPHHAAKDAFWNTLDRLTKRKEDGAMIVAGVLKALKISDKDAELLAQKGGNIGDAVSAMYTEQKFEKQRKEAQNDFMAWMAKNNKDGKGK